ncbi:MAG: lipoprotein LipL45 [Leptospira sp.]|nr:lipoprotein LipL45 [Leptospira sp.]
MKQPSLKIFIGTLALAMVFAVCKKPDSSLGDGKSKDTSLSAVVVFSVGDSKIAHADGTEEKAKLGVAVKTGDRIETGTNGKVDLQFESGSSIRIAPSTVLDFAKLSMNSDGGSDSKLSLASGKVFADVKKARKTDGFSVVTPTAIAGVRGTSFIVNADGKTGKSTVRVLEGAVATSPRIPALDNLSQEQIDADSNLKKLRESLQNVEVVVDAGKETSIDAKTPAMKEATLESLDIQGLTSGIEKNRPVLRESNITKSEEQELKTIVKVDEKVVQDMVALNQKANNSDSEEKLAEVERKKKEIEEMLATKQEEKKKAFETSIAQKPKELAKNKDIVSYYERIEKIVLADGKTEIVGAIINQEDNMMIVHTEQGIKKIKLDDIDVVIYDYQTKTKF